MMVVAMAVAMAVAVEMEAEVRARVVTSMCSACLCVRGEAAVLLLSAVRGGCWYTSCGGASVVVAVVQLLQRRGSEERGC